MKSFAKSAALLFLALRAGDIVSVAAGMWFVPRYVSPEDIGAVLPVASFATFLALPVFAFAMTVMRESACLAADGERGKIKTLLRGVFAGAAIATIVVVAATAALVPRFLGAMRVGDATVGALVLSSAFLGCVAPVYTDALQALKRFGALAFAEAGGAVARFVVMLATMPLRPLAGYFAGQAALPLFRMTASVAALRKDLAVEAEPFWDKRTVRRMGLAFLAICAYQAAPMAAALVEQSVLRTMLPSQDSAGFYMVSRFSDFLHYLTFPLLLVMFPYTAQSAKRGGSTRGYVVKCSAVTLVVACAAACAYALCGARLLALMPHGAEYAAYARHMPVLMVATALTACQVFYANAEVSAGRFRFLAWLVPLHVIYPAALYMAAVRCQMTLDGMIGWFAAASAARFAFAALGVLCGGKRDYSSGTMPSGRRGSRR